MKTLKDMDLTAEAAQLRLVKKLRDVRDAAHQRELDKLHLMLAKKTLEYYCADGYHAFFEQYNFDFTTDDGYNAAVRGHDMTITLDTPDGTLTGSGSTWDYIPDDLRLSPKPSGMDKKTYAAIKRRMEALENAERVIYPFHPLHRIGHGYFDTQICMYNAHKLVGESK